LNVATASSLLAPAIIVLRNMLLPGEDSGREGGAKSGGFSPGDKRMTRRCGVMRVSVFMAVAQDGGEANIPRRTMRHQQPPLSATGCAQGISRMYEILCLKLTGFSKANPARPRTLARHESSMYAQINYPDSRRSVPLSARASCRSRRSRDVRI